jgi:hypothetical protein
MNFFFRAFSGLSLIMLVAVFLSLGGITLKKALEQKSERSFKSKYAKERTYSAYVDLLKSTTVKPIIVAYGEARSWRTLELRATNSGRVKFLSDNFREGGRVFQDEVLFQIDPSESNDIFSVAKVNLDEALAEYDEANDALLLITSNLKDAKEQLFLRASALKRQKSLKQSGIVTTAAVESAELVVSNANQTVSGRKNELSQGKAKIERSKISVTRATISLEQAKRRLDEDEYRAPFEGIISKVSVAPGRLLNKNEQLGVLIDPEAIEVGFQVSNREFSRLLDKEGNVRSLDIKVRKEETDQAQVISGVIQRAGAEVLSGTSGRQIFASLDGINSGFIRAGDFLIVEIEEDELPNVAIISANAVGSNGTILLLDDESRLVEFAVNIIRRQDDRVILGNVPFGREYVTDRPPQLDAGLKVKPIRSDQKELGAVKLTSKTEENLIEISTDQRNKLIEFVQKNNRMPKDVKKGILKQLKLKKVPTELVDRLNKRIEGN